MLLIGSLYDRSSLPDVHGILLHLRKAHKQVNLDRKHFRETNVGNREGWKKAKRDNMIGELVGNISTTHEAPSSAATVSNHLLLVCRKYTSLQHHHVWCISIMTSPLTD
jgi:hypothetical protein